MENSQEQKVFVNIYRDVQVEHLYSAEAEQAYNEMLECLKLETKVNTIPHYSLLSERFRNIIETLTPQTVDYKKYHGIIPMEVLEIIKHAEDNKLFDKIVVRFDSKEPDPFLIGMKYSDENDRINARTWMMNSYLMAQWGPEKMNDNKLAYKAYVKYIHKEKKRIAEAIKNSRIAILEAEISRESLNDTASSMFEYGLITPKELPETEE